MTSQAAEYAVMPYMKSSSATAIAGGSITLTVDTAAILKDRWTVVTTFYEANGTTVSNPTAGTLVYTAEHPGNVGYFEAITNGSAVLTGGANATVQWVGPTSKVKVTGLDGVSGDSVALAVMTVTGVA